MLAMAALDEAADALDETVAALDTTTGTLGEKARANSGGEVPARERDRLPVTVDGGSTDG